MKKRKQARELVPRVIAQANKADAEKVIVALGHITKLDAALKGIANALEALEGTESVGDFGPLLTSLEASRKEALDSRARALVTAKETAWKIAREQAGVAQGAQVSVQYRKFTGLFDIDSPQFSTETEQLEVLQLGVSGHDPEYFRLVLKGNRLLKNGKVGKTPVEVELYPGLEIVTLKETP